MIILKNASIILLTLAGMEVFSWFIHKYLFHGPLWFIHKTHHSSKPKFLELNDIFSFLFAGISLYFMFIGKEKLNFWFWIGTGISLYGIIYFIFHDGFIHNRFKVFKTSNRYLSGIKRAHKMHHKSLDKDNSAEFGLLTASRKYFRK